MRAEAIISVEVRISKCPQWSVGHRKVHCTLSVDIRETESVFRIDCVAVIANTLSLRFSTKYLIALGCFIGLCKEKPLMTS